MKLPGTGHPHEYDVILAHPNGGIRSLDAIPDQNLLVSCGKTDRCVCLWKFDWLRLQGRVDNLRLESNIPFEELESLFYYVQLQDPSDLKIEPSLPLPLMSDFARAMGAIVSERQIRELFDEECLKKKVSDPHEIKISLYDAIRIYYNHFASDTAPRTIDELLESVFDEFKSSSTSKVNMHALIQSLVSHADRSSIERRRLCAFLDHRRRENDNGFVARIIYATGMALTLLNLDEILDAFRTLGCADGQLETLDDTPNELDREDFLKFFGTKSSSNVVQRGSK